jgi:hypothetical protein
MPVVRLAVMMPVDFTVRDFQVRKEGYDMRTTVLALMVLMAAGFAAGRPMDIRSPNLEPSRGGKPRPPVTVLADATNNLALGYLVTASAEPVLQDNAEHLTPLGGLSCITDGEKEHDDEHVNLPPGMQWVQISAQANFHVRGTCKTSIVPHRGHRGHRGFSNKQSETLCSP